MKRHFGILHTTGTRCIVVYREIPGDENYALVVEIDSLPDLERHNLINLTESEVAQKEIDLYNVLHKHKFANGEFMLQSLYTKNKLKKVGVDAVLMTPKKGLTVPLKEINKHIKGEIQSRDEDRKELYSFDEASPEKEFNPASATADTLLAKIADVEKEYAKAKEYLKSIEKRLTELKDRAADLAPEAKQRKVSVPERRRIEEHLRDVKREAIREKRAKEKKQRLAKEKKEAK